MKPLANLIGLSVSVLTGCASHRIEASATFQGDRLKTTPDSAISTEKLNGFPKGGHCHEPMLFVLSIGIIPTHCIDTYEILANQESVGTVDVISMSGWIPLFMGMLPTWRAGHEPANLVQAVRDLIGR